MPSSCFRVLFSALGIAEYGRKTQGFQSFSTRSSREGHSSTFVFCYPWGYSTLYTSVTSILNYSDITMTSLERWSEMEIIPKWHYFSYNVPRTTGDSLIPIFKAPIVWYQNVPSGKRLHNYGKSPFFIGKLTN